MEGIVTLIIIIIAFNIFNFIARAIRSGSQTKQKEISVGTDDIKLKEPVLSRENGDHDIYHRFMSSGDTGDFSGRRESKGIGFEKTGKGGTEQAAKPAVRRAKQPVSQEPGQHKEISANLRQVLTQKEPLVAAFIFHEIFDPPLALRRRR